MGKRCPSTGRRILSEAGGGMHPWNVILPSQIPPPGAGGAGSSTDEPLKARASIWLALSPGVLSELPAGLPGASKYRAQSDSLARGQRAWRRARQSLPRGQGRRSSASAAQSGAVGPSRPLPGDEPRLEPAGPGKNFPQMWHGRCQGELGHAREGSGRRETPTEPGEPQCRAQQS